jgi:hypothetical protein
LPFYFRSTLTGTFLVDERLIFFFFSLAFRQHRIGSEFAFVGGHLSANEAHYILATSRSWADHELGYSVRFRCTVFIQPLFFHQERFSVGQLFVAAAIGLCVCLCTPPVWPGLFITTQSTRIRPVARACCCCRILTCGAGQGGRQESGCAVDCAAACRVHQAVSGYLLRRRAVWPCGGRRADRPCLARVCASLHRGAD